MSDPTQPADVVKGVVPGFAVTEITAEAYRCTCGYTTLNLGQMNGHMIHGHPARRDPSITCHAAPMWDHERWCTRAKGHDGDHWTPSPNGGRYWPQSGEGTEQ